MSFGKSDALKVLPLKVLLFTIVPLDFHIKTIIVSVRRKTFKFVDVIIIIIITRRIRDHVTLLFLNVFNEKQTTSTNAKLRIVNGKTFEGKWLTMITIKK